MSAKEEPKKEGTPAEGSTNVVATEKKPAGTDAFVLLGEKLDAIMARVEKLESTKSEKKEEDEEEDEKTKKEITKDEEIKALMKEVLTKLNESKKAEEDEAKKPPKKEEDEEEDEDEKKPSKKEEKVASVEVKGAQVDTREDLEGSWDPSTISQAELRDKAWKEVLGAAKSYRVID